MVWIMFLNKLTFAVSAPWLIIFEESFNKGIRYNLALFNIFFCWQQKCKISALR